MSGVLKSAVSERIQGGKPSVLRASVAAVVAGAAAAVVTYRVMRS
jgi:hypothetical protein